MLGLVVFVLLGVFRALAKLRVWFPKLPDCFFDLLVSCLVLPDCQIGPTGGGGGGGLIQVGTLIWFVGPQRGPTRKTLKYH